MAQKKIYILDTNVLLHDPQSIFSFEKAQVGIPITVLEELDHFKGENSQRGRNTREVIRYLDLLRERGSLSQGVNLDNGGFLRVLFIPENSKMLLGLSPYEPDNQILLTALDMQAQGFDVRFISKDLNMRVKADVLGISAIDYLKDVVGQDQFYKGWIRIQVPAVQLKKDIPDDLLTLSKDYPLTPNEFVIVESRHNPHNYRIYRYLENNQFKLVNTPDLKWPIEPRNAQQLMALDLMLDKSIQLVTLLGPAGTGKTFLALVAALHELLVKDEFEKILITRPVIPLGPDIGYLPGDIHEKLHSWMQPIYDNMDFIVHTVNMGHSQQQAAVYQENGENNGNGNGNGHNGHHNDRKQKFKKREKLAHEKGLTTLDELIRRGKVSLEAITYMRGRSIPYQYIIIDEVQNLTPHEVKTLISRVGEGSKIILAHDPYQIDSPYLDFNSNGLVVASQRFKGEKLAGIAFLESSERSELSKLANML